MICMICGKECHHLGLHLNYAHKDITKQEYYDKYLKKENEGICKNDNCVNETKFIDVVQGYREYCCKKCADTSSLSKERYKATCMQKYGAEHNMKSEVGRKELSDSVMKKYGVTHVWKLKEIMDKCHETCVKNNPDDPYNRKQANLNTDWDARNAKIKERLNSFSEEKKNEIYSRVKNSRIMNNGTYWTQEMQEKSEMTCMERYGYKKYLLNPDNYANIFKNRLEKNGGYLSKSEKKFAEMLKNRNIDYKYDYVYNGKHWDFAIFKDDKLDILIEIDGEYYHGLLNDPDGVHVKGFNDHERFRKIEENVKFLVIDSKNINEGIKETINMLGIDYLAFIENIVNECKIEFPYPTYDSKRMINDYNRLMKYDNLKGMQTYSIINNYHKSIWHCTVGNKPSPYEAWHDDTLLRKCIENRFIYKSVLSTQNVLNGFNICKIAPKISIFNPNIAKHIVKTYLNEFETIFDPFSGYSGRMLGACACGKKYIGQDINEITVSETIEIIHDFNLNANVTCKDIFESVGEYDCLFTCSPYNDKENWGQEIKNLSCDEWIDICLERFKCKKYVFVVDNTEKYKEHIKETIENKSHLNVNNEYIIVI